MPHRGPTKALAAAVATIPMADKAAVTIRFDPCSGRRSEANDLRESLVAAFGSSAGVSTDTDCGSRSIDVSINGVLVYSEKDHSALIVAGFCDAKKRGEIGEMVSVSLGIAQPTKPPPPPSAAAPPPDTVVLDQRLAMVLAGLPFAAVLAIVNFRMRRASPRCDASILTAVVGFIASRWAWGPS